MTPTVKDRDTRAFPTLDPDELELLTGMGTRQEAHDGQMIISAGQADIDFIVVEEGSVDIVNPANKDCIIVTHEAGEFIGDIDLITKRPVIINAIARGKTRLLRISGEKLRMLLNTVPKLSEKLLVAFQVRRKAVEKAGVLGIKVIGYANCKDTTLVREFLYKNFVPFTWFDIAQERGQSLAADLAPSNKKMPVIQCNDGRVLVNPSLRELARCAGIWSECPTNEFDLAVVGCGPAGIAAAVYAASEGLRTIVLDRTGPGGQAGGSSRIENFIGFPAGLSGADLSTRGVLQMLKFGAALVAPIAVQSITPAESPSALHRLHLDCGSEVRAFCVLVATGVSWRKLNVPGSERFERAGIYYACTSVEAQLHNGTDVAVVGGGNSAGQAAMFLSESCAKTVHLLVRRDLSETMSDYLSARCRSTKNIVIHRGVEVAEVLGGRTIEAVKVKNKSDGKISTIGCSALFTFIGAEPHATWLPDSVERDELGYIMTGTELMSKNLWRDPSREPCPLETSLPRVLAGGDVRAGSTKRVGFAVGDGSLAVTCVHKLKMMIAQR